MVLTETPDTVTAGLSFDTNATVSKAMATRFDLKGLRQGVAVDDLLVAQAKDQDEAGIITDSELRHIWQGGNFFERGSLVDISGNPATTTTVVPGGPFDALNQLFGFGFPTYTVGLSLSLPLRDRNATANFADALVNRTTDLYRVRSTEQTVRLQVVNALTAIEQSKHRLPWRRKVEDLAQKRVDAEQKKYDLGTTTIFFVLAAQTDLTLARIDPGPGIH